MLPGSSSHLLLSILVVSALGVSTDKSRASKQSSSRLPDFRSFSSGFLGWNHTPHSSSVVQSQRDLEEPDHSNEQTSRLSVLGIGQHTDQPANEPRMTSEELRTQFPALQERFRKEREPVVREHWLAGNDVARLGDARSHFGGNARPLTLIENHFDSVNGKAEEPFKEAADDQHHQKLKTEHKPVIERWNRAERELAKAESLRRKEEHAHDMALKMHSQFGTPPPHLSRPSKNPFIGVIPPSYSPLTKKQLMIDGSRRVYRRIVGEEVLPRLRPPRSQSLMLPSRGDQGREHRELSRALHQKDAEIRAKLIENNKALFHRAYEMEGQRQARKTSQGADALETRKQFRDSIEPGGYAKTRFRRKLWHALRDDHRLEKERREIERKFQPQRPGPGELRRTQSVPRPPAPFSEKFWRIQLHPDEIRSAKHQFKDGHEVSSQPYLPYTLSRYQDGQRLKQLGMNRVTIKDTQSKLKLLPNYGRPSNRPQSVVDSKQIPAKRERESIRQPQQSPQQQVVHPTHSVQQPQPSQAQLMAAPTHSGLGTPGPQDMPGQPVHEARAPVIPDWETVARRTGLLGHRAGLQPNHPFYGGQIPPHSHPPIQNLPQSVYQQPLHDIQGPSRQQGTQRHYQGIPNLPQSVYQQPLHDTQGLSRQQEAQRYYQGIPNLPQSVYQQLLHDIQGSSRQQEAQRHYQGMPNQPTPAQLQEVMNALPAYLPGGLQRQAPQDDRPRRVAHGPPNQQGLILRYQDIPPDLINTQIHRLSNAPPVPQPGGPWWQAPPGDRLWRHPQGQPNQQGIPLRYQGAPHQPTYAPPQQRLNAPPAFAPPQQRLNTPPAFLPAEFASQTQLGEVSVRVPRRRPEDESPSVNGPDPGQIG